MSKTRMERWYAEKIFQAKRELRRHLQERRDIQRELSLLVDEVKPGPGIVPLNSGAWRNFRKKLGLPE